MAELKRNSTPISQLASLLMAARPQGHIYHLQSIRFGEHIALDEFYKGIGKATDKIIEVYQGMAGIITGYKFEPMREDNLPIAYLKELRIKIQELRTQIQVTSNLQNEIDNAVTIIDVALYKLINLK